MPLALLVILCLATREDKSVREHGCEAHCLLSMFLGCKVSPFVLCVWLKPLLCGLVASPMCIVRRSLVIFEVAGRLQ